MSVLPDRMADVSPLICRVFPSAGLPGARDGPPVEGDGAARAQQDEPAEPLHRLCPRDELYKNRSSRKTDSQQEERSSGSLIILKIV